jgi:hypothetical protein
MDWYFVSNHERKGPISQVEFDQLTQAGVITPATLVWREGMAEWSPWGQQAGSSLAAPPPPTVPGGLVCSQCGQFFAPDQVIKLGAGYVCAACKPIATQKLREGVLDLNTSEQIRKDHLQHEASIKSVGFLYFLAAAVLLLVGIVRIASASNGREPLVGSIVAFLFVGISVAQIWVGIGLRKLKPWARIPSGILSGLGLIGFPIGTLINGYILYLLFSKKGATVFSPDYQRVIAETPHIKYRTSIVIWILLGLLLLLIGLGMLGLLIRTRR